MTHINQFYYSALTQLRSPTFSICLDNKSLVRTLLRRYLVSNNDLILNHSVLGYKRSDLAPLNVLCFLN